MLLEHSLPLIATIIHFVVFIFFVHVDKRDVPTHNYDTLSLRAAFKTQQQLQYSAEDALNDSANHIRHHVRQQERLA